MNNLQGEFFNFRVENKTALERSNILQKLNDFITKIYKKDIKDKNKKEENKDLTDKEATETLQEKKSILGESSKEQKKVPKKVEVMSELDESLSGRTSYER